MDGATMGIIGGLAGAVIGVAGGAVGTWASVRGTRTVPERRFVIRVSVVLWAALSLLTGVPLGLALLGLMPLWLLWVPTTAALVALGPFIRWANARQAALRGDGAPRPRLPRPSS